VGDVVPLRIRSNVYRSMPARSAAVATVSPASLIRARIWRAISCWWRAAASAARSASSPGPFHSGFKTLPNRRFPPLSRPCAAGSASHRRGSRLPERPLTLAEARAHRRSLRVETHTSRQAFAFIPLILHISTLVCAYCREIVKGASRLTGTSEYQDPAQTVSVRVVGIDGVNATANDRFESQPDARHPAVTYDSTITLAMAQVHGRGASPKPMRSLRQRVPYPVRRSN
jgi:hypothetical protein